jgi:Aspartyl/Asparaginyl beta-hydroxylase
MIPDSAIEFHDAHVNDPRPLYVTGLTTAEDVRELSFLPWLPLKLPFEMPHEAMLAEAQSLYESFVPQKLQQGIAGDWNSLCVHGLSSAHTAHHKVYGFRYASEAPYDWTDICKFCPVTHSFFRDTFGYQSYHRIRFMLLKPGGYIVPHSDTVEDRLDAINIALNQPEDCDFVMAGAGVVPFVPGRANMMSVSRRHMVWNRSNENRFHMIVLGVRDPAVWDQIVLDSYANLQGTLC